MTFIHKRSIPTGFWSFLFRKFSLKFIYFLCLQVFINFAKDQTDLLDDELPSQPSKKKSSSFKKSMFICVDTILCVFMNSVV